jgi:hypothetical protein
MFDERKYLRRCDDCIGMLDQTGICYCDQKEFECGIKNPNRMRNEIVASRVTVLVENSDGTHMKSTTFMPHDIADHLHAQVIGWGRHWVTTFDDHDKYREVEKDFVQELMIKESNKNGWNCKTSNRNP